MLTAVAGGTPFRDELFMPLRLRLGQLTPPTTRQLPADFLFALLASAAIGYALAFNWGGRSPRAFQPLVLGAVLVLWRYGVLARKRAASFVPSDLVWPPLVFMLFMMAWAAYEDPTLLNAVQSWPNGRNGQLALCAVVLTYLPSAFGVREPRWLGHLRFAGFTLLIAVIGVHALHASPAPRIDVWTLQQQAVELLRAGKNPYRDLTVTDTGWGIPISFVYPPTAIYTGFFGKLLFDDVRYSSLVAIVMTGIGLRSIARRSGVALPALGQDAAALVFWLQPKLFLVLEQSWLDVLQLGFLAVGLAVFLGRFRTIGVVLMGVAFSSKQTMFWFAPLLFIFLDFRRRDWIALFATIVVLIAPFVVWDFRALKAANFDVYVGLSPRRDALAFMAWWYSKYQTWHSTAWLAWSSALAVVGVGAWRLRGSLPAFGLAATALYFLFFFFQKWAFANYYYLVDGLAALAAALALHGSPSLPAVAAAETAPETAPVS
jgi:hypothetical protein